MSGIFYQHENRKKIKRQRTSAGLENPRLIAARRADKAQKKMREEVEHTVHRLTKAEIEAQYPPEKIKDLIIKAQENLAAMSLGDKLKSETVEVPD